MLKLTWIEFFLRLIPETFILIGGIHIISRKSFDMPKYIFSSIVMAILSFFIRWLPIYFGVHMMINVILTICAMVIINIGIMRAIYSTLLITFLLALSEFLNMIVLNLLNINIESLSPFIKCLFGVPSLIMMSLFIIAINWFLKRKEGIKYVSN
ncbi:hypothetical protein [Clostridium vincentii]|uniref:Uncharacterized protein n=1 Tax=Clostridium vincentii TaxID=52704 RepID=A0A2T0BKI4_9CLOT|nr:hypothetical protein [Clostridium vincentii]PRR84312.1 hypothetical protein CLVI_02380 [Clostridium vincentii]